MNININNPSLQSDKIQSNPMKNNCQWQDLNSQPTVPPTVPPPKHTPLTTGLLSHSISRVLGYHKERVILGHVGYGPIGMVLVWSSALFWEDSEPGGPMIRAFLIGLKKARYSQNPSSLKSDTFQFKWFNLYLDQFLMEIMNLATKLLYST